MGVFLKKFNAKIGQRFGRWTVIEDLGVLYDNGTNKSAVMVKCDCGKIRRHFIHLLVNGISKSCGCFRKENASILISKRKHKHNLSKHPLFHIWTGMKTRCYNEKDKSYKRYGGRGIKMCDEWKNDFLTFYNWAINNGWKKGLINDRENNDGSYCPDNCRFITDAVSVRNRSNNINLTFNGVTKCITDWANEIGICTPSLKKRIKKWGLDRALTTPKIIQ